MQAITYAHPWQLSVAARTLLEVSESNAIFYIVNRLELCAQYGYQVLAAAVESALQSEKVVYVLDVECDAAVALEALSGPFQAILFRGDPAMINSITPPLANSGKVLLRPQQFEQVLELDALADEKKTYQMVSDWVRQLGK